MRAGASRSTWPAATASATAFTAAVLRFGGLDIVINTAAIYPTPAPGTPAEQVWGQAMAINVSSNHVLARGSERS